MLTCYKVNWDINTNIVRVETVSVKRDDIKKLVQYDYSRVEGLHITRKKDNYILSGGTSFFEHQSDKVKVILKDGSTLLTYMDMIDDYKDLYEVE